jgi:hypothetical protein
VDEPLTASLMAVTASVLDVYAVPFLKNWIFFAIAIFYFMVLFTNGSGFTWPEPPFIE